ncbi:cupin domain-containing protein [Microbacterium sp. HD4P20]|uniref:cupin domain-containing protein n=1 Tax=Microbacterium sp. HD4P20 TaxID=2864874 RepID=UPI001C6434AC|nr:cupin domain-containing protein [Microbacterium sp. HD4P20]MCP2635438.1 cupin domain-containing protein [Microbacterium sp. HD4P20]
MTGTATDSSATIQRRGDDPREWTLYGGNGTIGIEWYFRESSALPANVMLYHLEPGAEEGSHFHLEGDPQSCSVKSSDEMYVVTRGEIVFVRGDERVVLRAGDAAYAPHGVPHGVVNESDDVSELILVFGPPRDSAMGNGGVGELEQG